MKREKLDPCWHMSRVAARIWLKAQQGKPLSPRDKRLARYFAGHNWVENRLIQQGVLGRLGGPYQTIQTRNGPRQSLYVLDSLQEVADALG